MLYLTCTMISSVELANYGVSYAKDWVSVNCGTIPYNLTVMKPGHVAQLVASLTQEPEVTGSIPGPATYFRFSFR